MKTITRTCLGMFLALAPAACGGEPSADRIDTIAKLKILAVRAEKPALYPGETSRVDVLVAAPEPTSMTTMVIAFAQDVAADFGKGRARFGEAGTTFGFLPGTTIPTLPVAAGVDLPRKGAPNFGSVYYQAPATPGAYTLGAFVREGVPAIDLADPESAGKVIQAEIAVALKALKTMLVVPAGEPKNANPVIHRLVPERRWKQVSADTGQREDEIEPDGFVVLPEQVLRLRPEFTDEKPKRPSAVWWISGGETNGNGRTDIDWVAPAKAGIETIICVLLDREGGADWYFQDVAVDAAKLVPDVPAAGATEAVLALSGGRMVWLQFPAGATTAALRKAVGVKPQLVRATVGLNAQARLGWMLMEPVYEGVAAPATAATAQQIVGLPRGGPEVTLRIDAIVK